MTPQQLTALNLDKTGMLLQVLQKHYGGSGEELLGELQFSFLAFLMGQSLEGESPGMLRTCLLSFSQKCSGVFPFLDLDVMTQVTPFVRACKQPHGILLGP